METADQIRAAKQRKCARTPPGHDFSKGDHFTCSKCELSVYPYAKPKDEDGKELTVSEIPPAG